MSETEETDEKLSGKELAFVEAYFGMARFNGTEAARIAKFKGSTNVLAVTASRLLRKAKIKRYVDERFAGLQMPANEVLTRLTEIARGKVTDFLDDEGRFDLKGAKTLGVDHLIKKLKQKRTIRQKKTEIADSMQSYLAEDEINDLETETEILFEETEFELYSAHEALRDLGKHHKLFTDKTELSGEVILNHSIDPQTIKEINQAYDDAAE